MRLERASSKAISYACRNFHYAKVVPANPLGFNVFNDRKEWCGVILYGTGATPNIARPYKLSQGQVLELTRMALNGKQQSTSKAMAISLRLIRQAAPLAQLIVSYADIDQQHTGTIYQATNWIYEGKCNVDTRTHFIIHGKKTHNKSVHSKGLRQTISDVRKFLDPNATEFYSRGKHKYLYPLNNKIRQRCSKLATPYPAREA
jgi:hypothetical protein